MRQSKLLARRRRGARTRHIIARSRKMRVVAHRSERHTYAQLIDPDNRILASASTLEKELRGKLKTGTIEAARVVGERLAKKMKDAKIEGEVAFDRSGFKYHGRIKAVAEGFSDTPASANGNKPKAKAKNPEAKKAATDKAKKAKGAAAAAKGKKAQAKDSKKDSEGAGK